ncbi:MAG: proton-conducting transporter membrane subunit [Bacillota bacterium]|nr:proton-conducting transporter membrane subunit [Bacillota bacterium]
MNYLLLRILLCIFLPFAAGVVSYAQPKYRRVIVITTTLLVAGIVISLGKASLMAPTLLALNTVAPGVQIAFHVDGLSFIFALVSSVLWIPASIYAYEYMHRDAHAGRFFAYYLAALSVTMGIAFSGSLVTLYLFYELLTLVTYPLVVHSGGEAATEAGRAYIFYSLSGAALILLGIVLSSVVAPSLNFTSQVMFSSPTASPYMLRMLLLLFLFGFGAKAAIVPLHRWLPLAMAAPTPVSALLHAVAVVNAGSYGIIRMLYSGFGPEKIISLGMRPILIAIACVTILSGSLWALREDTLKRRLAYSTISQMGYLLLGAVLLVPLGLQATLIHFVNHALLKIALFFAVGALYHGAGVTRLSQVAGLGKKYPLVFATMLFSILGMIGIVPLNGFVSKWYYLQGALQGDFPVVIGVIALSSVLNAFYFLPIVTRAFFEPLSDTEVHVSHHAAALEHPGFVISCCSVLLGLFPHWLISLAERTASYLW